MLKIVVFDSGFGGELFADELEQELPVVEVIRVIDWRHTAELLKSPRSARRTALQALAPYIGRVDLIIFANHLLSVTSLEHFRRKFKNQKFIGLSLKQPDTFVDRDILILTTKALTRSLSYRKFIHSLDRHVATLALDSWVPKIDDGELLPDEIKAKICSFTLNKKFNPSGVILACSQFNDIKPIIKKALGKNIHIHDSFHDTIIETCRVLKLRSNFKKK